MVPWPSSRSVCCTFVWYQALYEGNSRSSFRQYSVNRRDFHVGRSGFTEAICQLVREKLSLKCQWHGILLLYVVGLMLRTDSEDGCYELIPLIKSGEDNHWIQLKRKLIKGPVPTRLTFLKRRMATSFMLFISRVWNVLILFVFPHDYVCTFLFAWKSYKLYPTIVF